MLAFGVAPASAEIEPLQSYGVPGGADAGGVSSTEGMGVDPISGKVVLGDGGNDRVAVFSPKGKFLLAFGKDVVPGGGTGPEVCKTSCQAATPGDGAGELDGILEAEVSPDGRVYVSEDSNNRISVFTLKGEFLFAFGGDVDPGDSGPGVCTTSCQAGTESDFGGYFNQPWASTFGPDGDLYLTDTDSNRLDRYTAAGEHEYGFGKDVNVHIGTDLEQCVVGDCQAGDDTGVPGSTPRPEGIDFGPDGSIWVGSWDGTRANVFTQTPGFVFGFGTNVVPGGGTGFEICTVTCQNGADGTDLGEFASVQGLAVDAAGTTYVADSGNNRINAYDSSGQPRFGFGYDVDPVAGTDFEVCRTACQAGLQTGALDDPYPVHTNCRGTIFTASSSNGVADAFGDIGAEPGPCKLKGFKVRSKGDGTATMKVVTPYAGRLSLKGSGLKAARLKHTGLEGVEKLKIEPKRSLRRKLQKSGKARARATVKLEPSDGNITQKATKKVKLKLG